MFRKDQNLYVYLEVYDPGLDAEGRKPSVAATLSFYRGKTKSFESQPVRLDAFAQKRAQTLPIKFQAPLAQLAPDATRARSTSWMKTAASSASRGLRSLS